MFGFHPSEWALKRKELSIAMSSYKVAKIVFILLSYVTWSLNGDWQAQLVFIPEVSKILPESNLKHHENK